MAAARTASRSLPGRLRLVNHQMRNSRSSKATAPKRIRKVGKLPRSRTPTDGEEGPEDGDEDDGERYANRLGRLCACRFVACRRG